MKIFLIGSIIIYCWIFAMAFGEVFHVKAAHESQIEEVEFLTFK